MNADLATKRWLIFSAAACLVPAAPGISAAVYAQGAAPVQAGVAFKKVARRATGPISWPELRLTRELGIGGAAEKLTSGSLPERPAELSENRSAAAASGRIPLPGGEVNRAGIVPASRLRLRNGSLILEADATHRQDEH
ncbi:MAG: hypothetical protein HZA62_13430 [Rhodocyclales bacterium]|nr:hypothetical protein [Rhodocyclales bacterium]